MAAERGSGLLMPAEMPPIAGLLMPYAFYWVGRQPAPLAGMPYPSIHTPWAAIAEAGFAHVVCLNETAPAYDPTPLSVLHAVELEDLVFGDPPREPEREEARIRVAAAVAFDKLEAGAGVVVHCYGGRGRSGTVLGYILRQLGYAGAEICDYFDRLHKARGKTGWPEAEWQREIITRL
jgi:protein-tyrosine phosphatase